MKRILSVILSLALLASALIIPMSVSAGEVDNNHKVVQFVYNDDNKAKYYSPDRNVSLGITPNVYVTDNTATTSARYQITNANIPKLSTGNFSGNDITFYEKGFYFRKKGADDTFSGAPLNGYDLTKTPGDFNFDQESFDGYVDIIYDLGAVIDINKVQHFSNQTHLSTGAYSFYAAVSAEDLFKSESRVFVYQNKNYSAGGCQQHTFDAVTARYAAFRIYYPIVFSSSTEKDFYNTLRIQELAVYGTKSDKIFVVKVNRALNNNIGIIYKPDTQCKLVDAEVGKKVKFTLDPATIPAGVDVTVKYGDGIVTPDENDVYTITVEKDKELDIIPSHVTTEFANADVSKYFDSNDTTTNIARGKTPYVFITNRNVTPATRTLKIEDQWNKISNLSNGDYTTGSAADVSLGINFCTDASKNEFLNGYVPYKGNVGADFDFTKDAANYQAYVDIIYDLGTTADIYKVQQMSYRNDGLQLGLYEVYASKDINDLFDRSKSLVVSYQNKTAKTGSTRTGNEQHEFPTRSARFVAFRVYSATTWKTDDSNTLRTRELAIYGTKTGDYTVSEKLNLPSSNTPLTPEEGAVDLLKGKQATVDYTDNGGTTTSNYNNKIISVLTDGSNQPNSHKDFDCATYQSNGTLNNGYTIDRNADVNIKFTRDTNTSIEHYTDFTFELNSYYKVTDFGFYHYKDGYSSVHKVQAFNVYIGNDKTNLYTEKNLAITCENYFNNSLHEFKFNKTRVGKYIGVRVLMSNLSDKSIRIAEIAAFGTEVGDPTDANLAPAEITSKSGYIYNKGGSSVFDYTNSNGETVKGTALRLTVGYKSPKVPGGADASKIILANGAEAKVIERNVIAIAKSKYDVLENKDLNIHTAGASVTTSTATSTDYPVSNYFKSEEIKETDGSVNQKYRMAYGALNINNISETNASKEVVVRGRVVYEYDGQIYAVYSDIVGVNETVSAQAAFDQLPNPKPTWFK